MTNCQVRPCACVKSISSACNFIDVSFHVFQQKDSPPCDYTSSRFTWDRGQVQVWWMRNVENISKTGNFLMQQKYPREDRKDLKEALEWRFPCTPFPSGPLYTHKKRLPHSSELKPEHTALPGYSSPGYVNYSIPWALSISMCDSLHSLLNSDGMENRTYSSWYE